MIKKLSNFFDSNKDFYSHSMHNTLCKIGCIIIVICFAVTMLKVCFPKKETSDHFEEVNIDTSDEIIDSMDEPPVKNFEELYNHNFLNEEEVVPSEVGTEAENTTTKEDCSKEVVNKDLSDAKKKQNSSKDSSKSAKSKAPKKTKVPSEKKSKRKSLKYYKKRAKALNLPEDYNVEKAIQGMNYLTEEQDFSAEGASGIIGNLFSESRFNGAEVYGSHIGIAQWDENRWPLIEDWLYINEYKDHSFIGQLMAIFESRDGEHFQETFHAMRKMSDAEVAAIYWLEQYEKAPGQAEDERQWIAQLTFELYTTD